MDHGITLDRANSVKWWVWSPRTFRTYLNHDPISQSTQPYLPLGVHRLFLLDLLHLAP